MPVDERTVDRLLSGETAPEDAPPELFEVAKVLRAASKGNPSAIHMRQSETVAAMVVATHSGSTSKSKEANPMRRFSKVRIAALAAGAMIVGTTGLALAGALPDAAQNGVARVFEKAGITIPNSHSEGAGKPSDAGVNRENSEVENAIDSTEPGLERGREVSDAASDGKSRVPDSVPVAGDNSQGGAGSGGEQSEGANETGIQNSEEASDGHSKAGSPPSQAD